MKAAQALLQRIAPTPARAKRSGKSKAKGASGRAPHQLRAEINRAAKRDARLARLKQPKGKADPRRPREPSGPKPGPS